MNDWKQTVIQTPRLLLRPWREEDAEALFRFACDPLVGSAAGWEPHADVAYSRDIIRRVLSARETYALVLRHDTVVGGSGEVIPAGTPVGSVGIMFKGCGSYPHMKDSEGEIGYWIGRPLWGRGLVPEAVRALIGRCFDELGLCGLFCGYYEGNEKSRRVQEKCGFLPRCRMEIQSHPLNGATAECFTYLSREDWVTSCAPVTHEMRLWDAPFRSIASGRKTVEMRLYDPKRQAVRVGDAIRFTKEGSDESMTVTVTALHCYPDFEALYRALIPSPGAVALGYDEGEIPDPADMLAYYSPDSIRRFGVVGIAIQPKE